MILSMHVHHKMHALFSRLNQVSLHTDRFDRSIDLPSHGFTSFFQVSSIEGTMQSLTLRESLEFVTKLYKPLATHPSLNVCDILDRFKMTHDHNHTKNAC